MAVLMISAAAQPLLADNTFTTPQTITSGASYQNRNNTFTAGLTVSGGIAYLYKNDSSSNTYTNGITGGLTVTTTTGWVDLSKYDSAGTLINTIDTLNFNATPGGWNSYYYSQGAIYLGGSNSQTTIDTLNWQQGVLDFTFANNSFGTTHVKTLNLQGSGSKILFLCSSGPLTPANLPASPTTQTLFTVDTVTGDPSTIQLSSYNPFTEVVTTNSSLANGVTVTKSGQVQVNLIPTATTGDSSTGTALSSAADVASAISQIAGTISEQSAQFTPTVQQQQDTYLRLRKAFKQQGGNNTEALLTAMSDEEAKVVKFKGNSRAFMIPYATHLQSNGGGGYLAGSKEKYYGMLFGLSRYLKAYDLNLTGILGVGASKTQMDRSPLSHANGKNIMAGVGARKTFAKILDVESNLYSMVTKNAQQRYGAPSPSQSYLAQSRYNTYALSWRTEMGPVVRLQNDWSIKPAVGLQLDMLRRGSIREYNAGGFNQYYRAKVHKGGEVWTGLGLRKTYKTDGYDGKITLKYDIGRKSGNGKTSTTIYADSVPNGVIAHAKTPGRTVHYLSFYGSVLNTQTNWKVVPGIYTSFQKGLKTITGTMKLEYRW